MRELEPRRGGTGQEPVPEESNGNASKLNLDREAKPGEQRQRTADRLSSLVLVLLGLLIGAQVYTWVALQQLMTLSHRREAQWVAGQETLQNEIEKQRVALNQALPPIAASDRGQETAIAAKGATEDHSSATAAHGQMKQAEAREKPIAEQQGAPSTGTRGSIGAQTRPAISGAPLPRDVSATRQNLSATYQDVDATRNDLRHESGGNLATNVSQSGNELAQGVAHGVAHGHDEIETLRKLGDRDYVEFTLGRSPALLEVAPGISLQLKKVDVKKSRCSLSIYADNYELPLSQAANEPSFFPIRSGWQSAEVELVINEVERDRVVGYLSALKGVLVAGK